MTLLAFSRPFWPLFLHVLGAMIVFGAVLAALTASAAGHRPAAFRSLLVAVPAWVLMRGAAQWIYAKEDKWPNNPTWTTLGFNVADGGLLLLLLAIGTAYWSQRSASGRARRIATALCGVYLVLLAVAWLAMSGKWR